MNTVIYLHGFNSSAGSLKAQIASAWISTHFEPAQCQLVIPEIPYQPEQAVNEIAKLIATVENPRFIGSSLGGFYANYFAEKCVARAVVVNPSIRPYELMHAYLGTQRNPYTGEVYTLTTTHILQLRKLAVANMLFPQNRMVLLQTNDEVLDYREAEQYYADSQCHIEQGGDHAFQDFEKWMPRISEFLQLTEFCQ